MQPQRWANHDNGTARVINTLAQQVLAETSLLTFDHVGQRFQRTLVASRNRTTTTAVVEQRINRFLQHALFVAYNNIWRIKIQQSLQTIVTVNNTAIQIVEIGRCKTTAI